MVKKSACLANLEENRRISKEKSERGDYDVFISYNDLDNENVKEVVQLLQDNGIASFREKWDVQPGYPWQQERDEQIKTVRSAAIFVGQAGIDSWSIAEIRAFEREFKKRGVPVIPVLLPDIPSDCELPIFLEGMACVDFRQKDPDPLKRLIFGITGKRPEKIYRPGILIASLGTSPVVVSSMYDLLSKRAKLTIERVRVLCPEDAEAEIGYGFVKEALADVELLPEPLHFQDANDQQSARAFLHHLVRVLSQHQERDDTVYLSLAGGRKSMAALMAWVAPLFPCVKKLYHVIDPDEEVFPSAFQIQGEAIAIRPQLMHPQTDRLVLVEIPFERGKPMSEHRLRKWLASLPGDYEEEEAELNARAILGQDNVKVNITQLLKVQFQELHVRDRDYSRQIRASLLEMSQVANLRDHKEGAWDPHPRRFAPITLHYYTGSPGPARPVFYTLPADIDANPGQPVEQVVICGLETPQAGKYRDLKEIADSPEFSYKPFNSVDTLPPVPSPLESVLVVPLGESPMVATQLYTLLREQELRDICEVVLIYPGLATTIDNGARLVKQALERKYQARCKRVRLPGLEDIASEEDCRTYQKCLEDQIARIQRDYPGKKIDLALSGGRKGMTAMTIFAAQKNHIPYVYHTLRTNEKISDLIDEQTSIEELSKPELSNDERDSRLFLRAYQAEGSANPYAHFVLFRVPVFASSEE